MSGNFYDNGVEVSYRFAAADLTSAGVVGRFFGPASKGGRVKTLAGVLTTDTDAAAVVTVDTNAGLADPVTASIGNAPGNNTGFSATRAAVETQTDLPADTVVEIQVDGVPTAGAADITVSVVWF